jgi:hypothetical protein
LTHVVRARVGGASNTVIAVVICGAAVCKLHV